MSTQYQIQGATDALLEAGHTRETMARSIILLGNRIRTLLAEPWEAMIAKPPALVVRVDCQEHGIKPAGVVGDQVYRCAACILEALPQGWEIVTPYLELVSLTPAAEPTDARV